jgi:hypothetical protein
MANPTAPENIGSVHGRGIYASRFVWGCPPLPQPAGCNVARGPVPRKGTSPGGQDWRKPSLSVDGSAQSDAKPEESEPNVDRGGLAFGMLLTTNFTAIFILLVIASDAIEIFEKT